MTPVCEPATLMRHVNDKLLPCFERCLEIDGISTNREMILTRGKSADTRISNSGEDEFAEASLCLSRLFQRPNLTFPSPWI
jgi:hypothetical protein